MIGRVFCSLGMFGRLRQPKRSSAVLVADEPFGTVTSARRTARAKSATFSSQSAYCHNVFIQHAPSKEHAQKTSRRKAELLVEITVFPKCI